MRVIDSSPFNRAIQLNSTEQLTSEFLVAALVHKGEPMAEATERVAQLFDAVEDQLIEDRA